MMIAINLKVFQVEVLLNVVDLIKKPAKSSSPARMDIMRFFNRIKKSIEFDKMSSLPIIGISHSSISASIVADVSSLYPPGRMLTPSMNLHRNWRDLEYNDNVHPVLKLNSTRLGLLPDWE